MNEQLISALQALIVVMIIYAIILCCITLTTINRDLKARKLKRERELDRLVREVETRSKLTR